MSIKQIHILLVESDVVQAAAIAHGISDATTKVKVVNTAEAGIKAADADTFNAVIVELALPVHNGIEFLHEFRSYAEWATIPVIVFSLQFIEDTSVFAALGPLVYLYKPKTSLAELKRQLNEIVQ